MQGVSEAASIQMQRRARLDQTLRYDASMHDDAAAKRFGFSGAIIPGVYAHSFMSQLVLASWGLEWMRRGTMQSRSRRPLYDNEIVTVKADAITRDEDSLGVSMCVLNAAGEQAALGHAMLPYAAPPRIDLADFPILPLPDTPPEIRAGEMKSGMRYGTLNAVVDAAYFQQSIIDFDEDAATFGREGIVHPGLLLRLSFRDTMASYRSNTPGLYVSSVTQFHSLLHVGEHLASSAVVVDAYERKGNHYVEIDQLLIANMERPVARIRRHSIYSARG
ncbi:hypothetical protein [Roseomonas fluvialis]|uniref:MaoC-like domain-containing protein n=1 Tax=Roseomonas fluvialis TaxID=1750527 RepID=A0ABM7Y1N0_9PROT|nr:hypothetical protein [Roseomonas fluvialis]BDG71716.1 hypothetical protein Rmf_16450 [Roseomonas fluvialis]